MMQATIQKIKESLSKVAPRISSLSLNEGAADEEIEQFEVSIDKVLPDDLKQLYSEINGNNQDENFGNFFYGMTFYSIDEAISNWNFRKDFSKGIDIIQLTRFDDQIDGSNFYNPNWIPIATDGSRSGLYVDLAPAGSGTYGQIIFLEGTELVGLLVANSTEELLQQFINDLDNGQYYLASDALEDEQHWLETTDNIDLFKDLFKR
jgi:cell wall assembly regulator SMI1